MNAAQLPTTAPLEIRRLTYADLPQVIAIERRAFPTPWSLAMFVLELSKPGGICLAARREGTLVGYLICSRYDTVWHIMNIAVDPDRRRTGIATALLLELLQRVSDENARYTLEVRMSNAGAIRLTAAMKLPNVPALSRRCSRRSASAKIAVIFTNSEGCRENSPRSIHRLAPYLSPPNIKSIKRAIRLRP